MSPPSSTSGRETLRASTFRPLACRLHASGYAGGMETTVVQVRDVPLIVVDALKARAEARGMSLSAYLRDLLASEAAMPPIEEVMETIATREPINYAVEDLRAFVEDERK